jgi:primosomal protein N' (replication factor Y)
MLQSFPLQSMARYVNVAVPLPVHKLFTYQVPEESPGNLIGVRALVPFGKRELTGVIVEELAAPPPSSVKPILELLDEEPLLPESLLRLTRWVAEYYFCSWGEALKAALPPGWHHSRALLPSLYAPPARRNWKPSAAVPQSVPPSSSCYVNTAGA